jgi:hypothetical protein
MGSPMRVQNGGGDCAVNRSEFEDPAAVVDVHDGEAGDERVRQQLRAPGEKYSTTRISSQPHLTIAGTPAAAAAVPRTNDERRLRVRRKDGADGEIHRTCTEVALERTRRDVEGNGMSAACGGQRVTPTACKSY